MNKKSFIIKLYIIILCIYSDIINFFNMFIASIKFKNEIKKSETFFNFCNDNINMLKKFKKIKNPKVSVVSPVYNREIFLRRFLKSIQHQNFDHIEIIFVDDKSSDNSANILKEYQNVDKRIKIIKHKRNKGTFISRNIGVLYSQAKYIILPDPDDIISKDIIGICLYYAENYKFEIIKYGSYKENRQNIKYPNDNERRPVYHPELHTYLFYGNNKLERVDFAINNKMIQKKLFIKALNTLNNFYLNIYITIYEDQVMNFLLYNYAKSFYYLKKLGYYYKINRISISQNLFKLSQIRMKFYFIYLKLVYEYTKNTKYEKDMANYLFTFINSCLNIERELSSTSFNDDFYFYYDIVNMLLNCKFTSTENKLLLIKLKKIIQIKYKNFANSIKVIHF